MSLQEKRLDVEVVVNLIKEKHIMAEEVYELANAEEQIRFELFKIIQNNFTINKCENCVNFNKKVLKKLENWSNIYLLQFIFVLK